MNAVQICGCICLGSWAIAGAVWSLVGLTRLIVREAVYVRNEDEPQLDAADWWKR